MRKPTPAMVVALAALFVAVGGVGVAATGGNFILGQVNSADKTTALTATSLPPAATCPAPCEALKVVSNSTAGNAGGLGVVGRSAQTPAATIQNNGGAPALRLLVNSGNAPFAVNSGLKVGKLNADMLDGQDASAFVRREGTILVSSEGHGWVALSGSRITYYQNYSTLDTTSGSSGAAVLAPDLPVALYGRRVRLDGVQLCYDAADPALYLDRVELSVRTTTNGPQPTLAAEFVDDTDRNDQACRLYEMGPPYVLKQNDAVVLTVRGKWAAPLGLDLSRATFVLSPTTEQAAAPS